MILTAIYHMFQTGEVFNPSDLKQIDMPEDLKQKQLQKNVSNAIALLKKQGILSDDFSAPSCA